jgi:hypothetical protein
MQLRRLLAISAVIGFVVPITSYTEWWLWVQNLKPGWGLNLSGLVDSFFKDDVLPIAAINVPLYAALALAWWAVTRHRESAV